MPTTLEHLHTKLFADSADIATMQKWYQSPYISGFTTNPTLMHQAGITNYAAFARESLAIIKNKPISFEVFSDDFEEMYHQARQIAEWGENVYVKIPVTNTKGQSSINLIRKLAKAGVKQNVTALMTTDQVSQVADALKEVSSSFISIFAGRIADTGRDPLPIMQESLAIMQTASQNLELIWASPREILNIFQANEINCHIITLTYDLLNKVSCIGKDLKEFSLETVKMFYNDALKAGFSLETEQNHKIKTIA